MFRKHRPGHPSRKRPLRIEGLEARQLLAADIIITEVMYNPAGDDTGREYVELYNRGDASQDLIGWQLEDDNDNILYEFSSGSLADGAYLLVASNIDNFPGVPNRVGETSDWNDGGLGNGGDSVILRNGSAQIEDQFDYDDQAPWPERADGDGSSLQIIDRTLTPDSALYDDNNWMASRELNGSPGVQGLTDESLGVVINEVLANSDDAIGELDKIELYNTSDVAIDLGGFFLTDSNNDFTLKFPIPDGTWIDPDDYVVFDETQFNPAVPGPGQTAFGISGTRGEVLSLLREDASTTVFVDGVEFGGTRTSISIGRLPNGEGRLYPNDEQTFGRDNQTPFISDVIISELMYNPEDPDGDGELSGSDMEFVELFNSSLQTVDLVPEVAPGVSAGWELNAGISIDFDGTLVRSTAPGGAKTIPAQGSVVVVPFDPMSVSTTMRDTFRTHYGIDASVTLIGPFSGSLSNGGELIELKEAFEQLDDLSGVSKVLIDAVEYDNNAPWPERPALTGGSTYSINRTINTAFGMEAQTWQGQVASPGTHGLTKETVSPLQGIIISEVMYNPTTNPDPTEDPPADPPPNVDHLEYIELFNTSGSLKSLTNAKLEGVDLQFGAGSTLAAGARLVVVPFNPAVVSPERTAFLAEYDLSVGEIQMVGPYTGTLSNGGEDLGIVDAFGNTFFRFDYDDSGAWPGRADGNGSSLELIDTGAAQISAGQVTAYNYLSDGDNWRSSIDYKGSPGVAGTEPSDDVVVNEVLAHTDPPLTDAIELHNMTGASVSLNGWWLSDSNDDYFKYEITSATIGAHGYITFSEPHFNGFGAEDPFSLNAAEGDDVYLLAEKPGGGYRFADNVDFGPSFNGESFGRHPNGTGDLFTNVSRTFGWANSEPEFGPLVITEMVYDPDGNNDFEFVEVYNNSDGPLFLNPYLSNPWRGGGWRLDGVDFTFPNETMSAREVAVVVPFDPVVDTQETAAFRAEYGIDAGVRLFGPFSGRLNNNGERVQLVLEDDTPLDPPPTEPNLPLVVRDEVNYEASTPWPTVPPGTDASLTRRSPGDFGNDPASWDVATPTPGSFSLAEPTSVQGRLVFYNNSVWDGENAAANVDDGQAVAPDPLSSPAFGKTALRVGETATLANVTNYSRGINGIMVDIANPAGAIGVGDFAFRVGNADDLGTWTAAPTPTSVTTFAGQGTNGADRVTIIWADNAIQNEWLEVTVKGGGAHLATTGLTSDDTFYYGNAIGETGNDSDNAMVTAADLIGVRDNPRGEANRATLDNPYDFDRNKLVDAADMLVARNHVTGPFTALRLIDLVVPDAPPEGDAEGEPQLPATSLVASPAPRAAVERDDAVATAALRHAAIERLDPAAVTAVLRSATRRFDSRAPAAQPVEAIGGRLEAPLLDLLAADWLTR